MEERQQLLQEIIEISAQYRSEVPGRRKTWPKAIRQRVLSLKDLGLSFKAISDQTGIPYYTVLNWRSQAGKFKQVATVTVPTPILKSLPTSVAAKVTVTTPQGYRIEGLGLSDLILFLEKLK